MTDIERLLAIEEIKQLKSDYFYLMDNKHWERWRDEVWAPDAVLDVITPKGSVRMNGAQEIIDWVKENMGHLVTTHFGHMPKIEILSDTTAKGRWALEDVLRAPKDKPSGQGFSWLHGFGHYLETYIKTPNGWRIKTSDITRLHVDVELTEG